MSWSALFLLSFAIAALSIPIDAAGSAPAIDLPMLSSPTTTGSAPPAVPSFALEDVPLMLSPVPPGPQESRSVAASASCSGQSFTPTLPTQSPTTSGSAFIPTTTSESVPAASTDTVSTTPSTSAMSYASPSLAPSSTTASLSSSPTPSAALYSWNPPANISDLTPFNITYFPSGQDNLHIVSPSSNQTNSTGVLSISSFTNLNLTDDDSALELFYPAHSINPGNSPQGGAEFYAQPLDLSNASSVTLEYSVFFPDDFDWVKAGKLPGIYGGHTGCSGGDDADDCFSTRLMWREGGLGELYLYAPRDKQAKSVCETPPQSVCDSEYGLSIGRGSFNFTKGNWTHVRQTVTLNTPGMQDGAFVLEVNGQRAINGSEIFYRGFPGSDSNTKGGKPPSGSTDSNGGLLGSLLGGLRKRVEDSVSAGESWPDFMEYLSDDVPLVLEDAGVQSDPGSHASETQSHDAVGFTGLFFSTFFGGHEPEYATPKDQYTWFKGFNLTIDS